MVEYYIRSGYTSSPSQQRVEEARKQLDIIKAEAETLGYKVTVVDRGLEVRP